MVRRAFGPLLAALAAMLIAGAIEGAVAYDQSSEAGGAGYALLFHDNVIIKKDFRNFPSTEFTFEAWLSTSDICHKGAIMSYAKPSTSSDPDQRTQDANHFVIYDPSNVLACHDFETIDEIPEIDGKSCHAKYSEDGAGTDQSSPITTSFLSRTGDWHHLAVTWSIKDDGLTKIYQDGLLVAKATTGKTEPLVPNGSLMLGGEQDCFGGCTDPKQGYFGFMDEVRIWATVRNQTQIINDMRKKYDDMSDRDGLVAYWPFDDLDTMDEGGMTHDLSGNDNDLDLLTPPESENVDIKGNEEDDRSKTLETGALKFKNNYAMAVVDNMPTESLTVEFWARTQLDNVGNPSDRSTNERYAEFLTFATQSKGDGDVNNDDGLSDTVFMDDAIRIERYLTEFNKTKYLRNTQISTLGAISVHINANRQGNGRHANNWIDFATEWTDDEWHHIAVTWEFESGKVQLFFDGDQYIPFWRSAEGEVTDKDPIKGGVQPYIARRVQRLATGSLVLGQNQECFGGCFSPGTAYNGYMANLRIWDRVLDPIMIRNNMFTNDPRNTAGLALSYVFSPDNVRGDNDRDREVVEKSGGNPNNNLVLGSIGPTYEYSYAPLSDKDFIPLEKPKPGYSGYAMKLHDEQVLLKQNFYDFPTDAITVEFWMWSIDGCWQGVPFSYANGDYEKMDNAFLIFNYNNWGVSIMEQEGTVDDHNAGFGSTDGRWHHIAVTWESLTGQVALYDNGRQAWYVKRAAGLKIPPGGTLVLGREQDCLGGCFDSRYGAAGDVQPWIELEYGAQDFFGVMDQIRIWNVARTPDQIYKGMLADQDNGSGTENRYIDPNDPTLVAYWKFDEGKGYIVHDETPRGNHLHIMEEPDWLVMRWMERCGNGIKEGVEKCDDGNIDDGDGCSSICRVESGWECTPTSPSRCWKLDGSSSPPAPRPPPPSPTPPSPTYSPTPRSYTPPPPEPTPYLPQQTSDASTQSADDASSGPKSKKSGSGWAVLTVVCVVVGIVVLMAIVYRKREFFYDRFPQLEQMVNASQDRVGRMMGRQPGYDGVLSLDPEADMDHPAFVDSQPPAAYQPPGRPIPYAPMPDAGGN